MSLILIDAIALPVGCARISQESNMPRPRMSQFLNGPAHQFARFAPPDGIAIAPLLVAQRCVTDRAQDLVERGQIVAAVVSPAERRLIRELLLADQLEGAGTLR